MIEITEGMTKEEILEKVMNGITVAGTAKAIGKEAIMYANGGAFDKAREAYGEAVEMFLDVHESHFNFIQLEAQGMPVDLSLLLIHMEDHIMATSSFLDTIEDQILIVERITKLEKLVLKK